MTFFTDRELHLLDDCCDAKEYVDSKTLEEYGQRQRNTNLEDGCGQLAAGV